MQHLQYYKDSIYIKKIPEEEFVSTLVEIKPSTEFVYKADVPITIDPTRKPIGVKYRVFKRFEVQMHHLSYVRRDLNTKLSNSSLKIDPESPKELILGRIGVTRVQRFGREAEKFKLRRYDLELK